MTAAPLLLDIKANALDDGPGIRSVVFFKGCPLDCRWCHNPESKACGPELSFDPSLCVGCKACLTVCPYGALQVGHPIQLARERCNACLHCTDACPSHALSPVGRSYDEDELLATLLKDRTFFQVSQGGITLSGGEPTLHLRVLQPLLQRLKQEGIHTLLQTCGFFHRERFLRQLYPLLDLIHFDLKLFDDDEHRAFCGQSNESILANFLALKAREADGGAPVQARIPLVPGITATEHNLRQFANFFIRHGVKEVQLLNYNPLWPQKQHKLGHASPPADSPLCHWLGRDELQHCADIFRQTGIAVVND